MGSAMNMPYELLRKITDDFSEERIVGRGSFGVVYKGMIANGVHIAVKVLRVTTGLDDRDFINEFENLARLEHQNIVELVGYCNESAKRVAEFQGREVIAEEMHTALCFEFVDNGSLDKHLSDENQGLNWHLRYKIIKGICEGLKYLNDGLESPIWHLDLKPENILLDKDMMPKIADFGLSRLIGDEGTKKTMTSLGTLGYWPPEYVRYQEITKQFDIFSLGVILMKIMMGTEGYYSTAGMQPRQLVKHVHNKWRTRLRDTLTPKSLEVYCQQVKICIEIASKCLNDDRHKRPSIQEIVFKLNKTEEMIPTVPLQTDQAALDIVAMLYNKVREVKEIQNELTKVLIQKKIPPYRTMEHAKDLIAEIWELAHHAEDVIDECSYHTLKLKEENALWRFFSKKHITPYEIVQVQRKIEKVMIRGHRYLLGVQLIRYWPHCTEGDEVEKKLPQDSLLETVEDHLVGIQDNPLGMEGNLVGIEDNKAQLTEWLYSEEQDSTVITVSGMGGLGKTTLVRYVYEKESLKFPAHAWIFVSQTCDAIELLWKLVRMVEWYPEESQLEEYDADDLKAKIKERLKDRKFLLVLDDVWNQDALTQIGDTLQNLQASRVIITTRQEHVATLAQPTRQLKLKPLEHNDAFVLFCRKAFNNRMECRCPHDLENLANHIVDRCQGLPLAVVSIGGMLSSLPLIDYVWNEMYNQLRDELENTNYVSAILNLSYHDLPGELRNCFLYCSLFPQDHTWTRESLVRLWVAERFAVRKEQRTAEEMADRYLTELIQRNMLQAIENDELGRVSTCKMHDIVRDLALSMAKEQKFGFANDFLSMLNMDTEVRRMSSNGWKDKTAAKVKLPRLRTVVAFGTIASSQLLSPILSESLYLTVLELQDSEITEVPASIGNMFNLRYIGLRRTRIKSLPESIGRLSNLQTLDIKQTKIEKLPRGIAKNKKLRHLLADRYADEKQSEFRYFIGLQAPKELSNMEELQTLETVEASKELAEQLMKLMKLQSVWIDNINPADCATLFAALSKMPILSTLLLSASDPNKALCFEALKPESNKLHRLITRGSWADNTLDCPIFHDHGKHLKYLAISWCSFPADPLQLLASYVPNLTYLSLNMVTSESMLVLPAGCFPNLKTLVLKRMNHVNQLEIKDGALSQIEGLYVVKLPKLDKIPQGIESLCSLKKLWLLDLHKDFRSQWNGNRMQQKMQHVPEILI